MSVPVRKCAIYTRKSTEDGLEQEFNSLDAQYEACQAYIKSQKSEGWILAKTHYEDGGFSGGNIDRPGLTRLLEDIKARKVNTVVVYKIDRLTRSLLDFSRLVGTFDEYGVTFVSVTQSFNTTTSMGRLTLHVFLSFAQFEREVIAERVRDKFSASKKRGIWMGGTLPMGYRVDKRQLFINPETAGLVGMIFERYLELGSICKLMKDLRLKEVRSPVRTRENGRLSGGCYFTGGALRHILHNPIYIGKIRHKDKVYDGLHEGIISPEIWQRTQDRLHLQAFQTVRQKKIARNPEILLGKLFDMDGNLYTRVQGQKGKRGHFHYYVSPKLQKCKDHSGNILSRISAPEIEGHIQNVINARLGEVNQLNEILQMDPVANKEVLEAVVAGRHKLLDVVQAINKISVGIRTVTIEIRLSELCPYIDDTLKLDTSAVCPNAISRIETPFRTSRSMRGTLVIKPEPDYGEDLQSLKLKPDALKDFVRGTVWRSEYFMGYSISRIASREGLSEGFVEKLIRNSLVDQGLI
jgi:DNA invertase Pin-like site-specific DNA recombinase